MAGSRWRMLGVAVAVAVAAGCLSVGGGKTPATVSDALDAPDEFILYSLEPAGLGAKDEGTKSTFHGHTILGQTAVKDRATQKKLVAAFNRGVSDHDGTVAACFIPHHGLRVVSGKRTVELVVCFMCAQVHVYVDGKQEEAILISTTPRAAFNDVLTKAGVPLAEKAK